LALPASASAQAAARTPGQAAAMRNSGGRPIHNESNRVAKWKPVAVPYRRTGLTARQQQMQALRADASLAEQDRHVKARAIMQDSDSKIEAVMNDTQKQQFEQMLAERRAHRNRQPQA